VCLLVLKIFTTEGTEFHRGKHREETAEWPECAYCGGFWMLSSCTSKISAELGGMVPSGVPFSP
jgi:hypothetical protein